MRVLNFYFVILVIILIFSCSEKAQNNIIAKDSTTINQSNIDSTELTNLVRQVYEWHMNNETEDFPYKYEDERDSIFIGIDWDKYQNNTEVFKMTNFFSIEFLNKHKEIAKNIDASIRKADLKWRNRNDGISLWETGADDWCGCQDYPDNYWKTLTIDSLVINKDIASFIWTWDEQMSHTYRVKANKENGKWKINSLNGFKYFYTTQEYEKMMKEDN
ncbi:hypothetical protein OJ995_02615 [Flavobacterium sp. TH16-21]|uniref:DUF3828 domain-containing protein n=2 Tax=Flavobacterium lacisediminis TaxID=2989705 RepID=A0ABT3EEV8_9FLAO|nr:hypothetical protein [Flavobacterium lacisediminis]